MGPSGAGKTTVLNILGGMDTADEGQVLVDGNDIVQYTPKQLIGYRRHDIGFVFQFYNLVQNLTALENVELAAQICHDPIPAAEALEAVGLGHRLDNFPAQLSGGEQQRVAIARAIGNKPQIVIADEPTGNLDPKHGEEIFSLFEAINSIGTTVMMATHDELLVDKHPHRVVTLANGRIVRDSTNGGYWLDVPDKN